MGTGLGMCVVRSMLRYGGHVNIFKNVVGKGEHGISLHISFPKYEIEQPEKHDIVLIRKVLKFGKCNKVFRMY